MSGLGFSISITGVVEQLERFKNADLNLQPHEIGEIINWALDGVKTEAQANASTFKRTGTLMNSIINYMITELAGECVALAPYAAPVEFGYISRGGKHVQGRRYFTPAAIHGAKTLIAELSQYTVKAFEGKRIKPKTATRSGGGKGLPTHKYLFKQQTGAGARYRYSKKSTTVTSFKTRLYPGAFRSSPRPRGGRSSSRSR